MQPGNARYWALNSDDVLAHLRTQRSGLSSAEAAQRLKSVGRNELHERQALSRLRTLLNQLRSPLLLLLLFAAAISMFSGEWVDASIVFAIVVATVFVGYSREFKAQTALEALQTRVKTRTSILRDGALVQLPIEEVVPGDVIQLAAGSIVPADALILEQTDCHLSEAILTGESFPVSKFAGVLPPETVLARRTNSVYLGTNVRSGTARCVVVATGPSTEFGGIAHRLSLRPPETEFDRGLRRFGYLLTVAMFVMVIVVFATHLFQGRPAIETLLFAIALAVGLSPELLPAVLSINLARSAEAMAKKGVLVRRLNAIENLGSMDILCTDKTGTLTKGSVELEGAYDIEGVRSAAVLELGAINAALETGLPSPLDDAILTARRPDLAHMRKLSEIPFDFMRRRISVVVEEAGLVTMITKGAFHHIVEVCATVAGGAALDAEKRAELEARFDAYSAQGIRVLAVGTRVLPRASRYERSDEHSLVFAGFLTFADQPKEGIAEAIRALSGAGVSIKVITGDVKLVAQHVARLVGLRDERILTGTQLDNLHDEALWQAAERTDIFAEVDPNQKERIILALKKMGHVVGFLGDGVNDAPAMHAADTSISVEKAVDVARAAADFVLLDQDLNVIRAGIEEGRRTFANTLKYILTTTSANLGNMVSMAFASLFLPFLPLLAGQILLNNFLSDIPAVGIAGDAVDPELVEKPRRWDMKEIARYMLQFGALSSVFDFLTFGTLLFIFHANAALFRTGWFVESLLTELVIALVVRTRRPFFRSRPGKVLLVTTVVLVPIAFAIPYLPYASGLGFVAPPISLLVVLAVITMLYVAATEVLKRWFYRAR